jgi:hypothetical protein
MNIEEEEQYKFTNSIIFLNYKYFKPRKFRDKNTKLIKKLTNLGIKVINISEIENYKEYRFNDEVFPSLNTLYHHLFNGYYYSDDNYSKKKLEKEREILFLLAGKLGVSTINYCIETSDVKISIINSSVKMKSNLNFKFNKTIENTNTKSYDEEYSNRGAPVYIVSKNLKQVEENIQRKFKKLNDGVFSYNFYEKCDKLRTFVYKRFNFKMKSLKYETESDNMLDINFETKFILMNYGIGLKFNEYKNSSQKILYKMIFFSDKDLRLELDNVIRLNEDPFHATREVYESMDNKDVSISLITQYVINYARNMQLNIINRHICDDNCKELNDEEFEKIHHPDTITYENRLNDWINENSYDSFKKICESFISTYQIENWLVSNVKLKNNEYYDSSDDYYSNNKKYGIFGIDKLKKHNYKKYKNRLLDNSDASESESSESEAYGGECDESDD